jgi:hypothetical protein
MKKEYSAKDLEMIWRGIKGATPDLYVPVSRFWQVQKTGPNLAVFKSYAEISGEGADAEKYWEALNQLPLNVGLSTLSAINLILAITPIDKNVHDSLNRTFLREAYLSNFADLKEEGPQPDIQIVFSRGSVLANLKALLAVGSDEGETQPLDLHLIGDIALLCNDYVGSQELRDEMKSVSETELMMEALPTWELDNLRSLPYALARVVRMIEEYLPGDDPKVALLRRAINLDPSTLRYDGLEIEDYIAIIFGIFAHGRSLKPESVFSKPAEAVIDPKTFFSKINFPQEKFEQFLSARSLPTQGFREKITKGDGWDKESFFTAVELDQFANDTLVFKTYPFLHLEEGRELIVDIQYVSEILIYGLYWRIIESLQGKQKDIFISLWGRLFELYLFDLFGHYYPETSQFLSTEVDYEGGQIDALLDFGTDVVIFEFKASLLRDQTKNSRDIRLFEEEVTKKFIENEKKSPKALRQLAAAATAIRKGKVKTAMKPERIYPVFVGYEPVLESFFVNTYLQQRFRGFVPKKEDGVVVQPISVMSVDELEKLLPNIYAGACTWMEILNERFDEDRVKAFSVHQTLYDLCQKKRVEIKNNDFLLAGFDEIFSTVFSKYRENDSEQQLPVSS